MHCPPSATMQSHAQSCRMAAAGPQVGYKTANRASVLRTAFTGSWHHAYQQAESCRQARCRINRERRFLQCMAMATRTEKVQPGSSGAGVHDRIYAAITGFPFPIGPTFARPTIRYEAVKGSVWTFEQPQKLSGTDVHINVRMTAVKLQSGGLLIYSPIAPTKECIRLIKEMGYSVEHILLTTHAYEHKLFVAPFARKFPEAKLFGIFPEATLREGERYPWSEDLDFRIFKGRVANADFENVGSLTEVAMYHRASRTLLLTDAVIYVPLEAPEVVPRQQLQTAGQLPWYVRFLYGSGQDTKERIRQAAEQAGRIRGPGVNDDGTKRLGWQRCCILVLCLKPENLLDPNKAFLSFAHRLTISPVVERLVFSKVPEAVADWVEDMCSSWDFQRIIPCHFAGPVLAKPADLRKTFDFAYQAAGRMPAKPSLLGQLIGGAKTSSAATGGRGFPAEDVEFLRDLSRNLTNLGLTLPDKA